MSNGLKVFAPAKINLTLHITGQRDDEYHLLDSLVVFVNVGDQVLVKPALSRAVSVHGPMAGGVPTDQANLVWRAAELFNVPAEISVEKHLPMAAGLGGGSSDAAAALRAFAQITGQDLPTKDEIMSLGADVPVCLRASPTRMSGVGEVLDDVPDIPPLHFVLANPRVPVSTPDVFGALSKKNGSPMSQVLPEWPDAATLARWLSAQRNDLELPARGLVPAIGVALSRIGATQGCLLARMTGSGGTCFGLYATRVEAEMAAKAIAEQHPEWWSVAASSYSRQVT